MLSALATACDRAGPSEEPGVANDAANNATASSQAPAAAPPSAPAVIAAIPAPYLGTWDQDVAACDARFSDMRLVVDSSSLRFYESVAEVQRVTPVAGGGIDVAAVVSGEGMTNETVYRLRRSEADTLTITVDDAATRRVRCG